MGMRRRSHRRSGGPLQAGAVCLVTGAGSGIGRSTALELARRDCVVAVVDIDGAAAQATADAAFEVGVETMALKADVSDREQLARVADEVEDRLGPIDVLVNNAGVGMTSYFLDASLEDWDWIRSINLDGVVNGCDIVGRRLVERGRGHVVNVSSGLAYTPRASEPHYVTTKAAVLALSRCLRADWSRHGVGVSAVCPGVVNTPIFDRSLKRGRRADSDVERRVGRVFARGHDPSTVATAVCRAVERDLGVVPVGWEARLGWSANGMTPQWIEQRLARLEVL